MPWTRENNPEFLRLLKELNANQLKPGREATPPQPSAQHGEQSGEQAGEGLREQISANKENIIDEYATSFAQGTVPE